jgi:HSP20 family protein
MISAWNAVPMLDRLFDGAPLPSRTFHLAVDVRATENELVFVCDVPGVKREDLEVLVEGGVLSIKGHREDRATSARALSERAFGSFAGRYALPDYVDAEGLTAELADGVLTVRVPKQPKAKRRRIEIGVGR